MSAPRPKDVGSFRQEVGAFGQMAAELCRLGLGVMPLGGDDGKVPLVKGWTRWKKRPGEAFRQKLIDKHPEANIGVICGLSGVFIVDIDDPSLVRRM